MNPIASNLTAVKSRIAAACERAGRKPEEVRLLPVSKTRTAAEIVRARSFGLVEFGENRMQEASAKAAELVDTDIQWVIIGHMQTNKAKVVVDIASEFQALDSLEFAAALDRRLQAAGKQLDVLIQINSSGESTKFGLRPDDVENFAKRLLPFETLRVKGLMTIAVRSDDQQRVEQCFQLMQDTQLRLSNLALPGQSYQELSMGMSGDFELAIEHGATTVRIGESIFGPRPDPAVGIK